MYKAFLALHLTQQQQTLRPRVATCSLRDLVLGWTTQHSFGRGISKVVYIEYHKFFLSFTNSALFLRPLCFQLNKCIFNRTSCSPPWWEEFLFFAWRLWWRTGEGLEHIVARMLIICAHRSILPGATWQLIYCVHSRFSTFVGLIQSNHRLML